MNFLKRLIRPLVFTRALQEQSDFFRLFLLLGQYEGKWTMPEADEPEQKRNEFLLRHYKMSYTKQRIEVQNMAHLQMLTLFDKVVYVQRVS